MTYTATDIATAIDELQALVELIERPPLYDVKLSQSVALRTAAHIRTLIASAPAGDAPCEHESWEVDGAGRRTYCVDCREYLGPVPVDQVADAGKPISPTGDGEQIRGWWTLEWIAAPRPPVHMKPMRGSQDFDTAEAALAFWHGKPDDSTYVGLTRHVQTSTLQSPPAKVDPCTCERARARGMTMMCLSCDKVTR